MNKIIFIGNLGKDPEMRYTPTGQPITSFNVASNREYTKVDGTRVKETVWAHISFWGKQAEICKQYLHKGSLVYIDGRLNPDPTTGGPRIWEKDGFSRSNFEITGEFIKFLSTPQTNHAATDTADAEDVPF